MADLLTRGALATIMQGGDFTEPIVQVLSVKKMNTGSGLPDKDRYRAFLSDGQYTVSFAMMTAPVYAKAGEKGLSKFSIMKIVRFITSVINNTEGKDSRVLLILDLEVLKDGDEVCERIGNPIPYTESTSRSNEVTSSSKPSASVAPTNVHSDGPTPKMPRLMNSSNAGTSNGNTSNGNTSLTGHLTHPISSLSPYHNKWVIKARVMNKSDIRTWENNRGKGQLFSFDLIDESGEIRCTAFRDLVDKYFDYIKIDKVYYISKCQIKAANKQFCTVKNDYEMTLGPESVIEECHDDDMANVQTKYNFQEISKVAELEPNQVVDVIGVAKSTSDLQTFQAKSTGRELKKKEIQLVDQSNTSVTLTLWGSQAENFDGSSNPVISLKGARVSEYGGGKTLSTISGTLMRINPEIKECYRLKGWFESEGMNANTTDISAKTGGVGSYKTPWMCFKEVSEKQLGTIDPTKGDYYQLKGTILLMRAENSLYKACPKDDCNKKVVDQSNGEYRCEKCQREYNTYKYRFLCSMNVGDWSGNQWVSMFSTEAEKVVGLTSEQAGEIFESDHEKYNETLENCHFKEFILRLRAKVETYQDENRLKTVAVRVDPVNYEEYTSHLISNIKRLTTVY